MDKDAYFRGFADGCDVIVEWMRESNFPKRRIRELRDFVDEQVRRRKAKEILADMRT